VLARDRRMRIFQLRTLIRKVTVKNYLKNNEQKLFENNGQTVFDLHYNNVYGYFIVGWMIIKGYRYVYYL